MKTLPRQPFLDWLKQIDPACPEDSTIYLIPETDTPEDARTWMRRHFDIVFTQELAAWYLDESLWPAPRDFTLFEKWFSWTSHSLVQDLANPLPPKHYLSLPRALFGAWTNSPNSSNGWHPIPRTHFQQLPPGSGQSRPRLCPEAPNGLHCPNPRAHDKSQ